MTPGFQTQPAKPDSPGRLTDTVDTVDEMFMVEVVTHGMEHSHDHEPTFHVPANNYSLIITSQYAALINLIAEGDVPDGELPSHVVIETVTDPLPVLSRERRNISRLELPLLEMTPWDEGKTYILKVRRYTPPPVPPSGGQGGLGDQGDEEEDDCIVLTKADYDLMQTLSVVVILSHRQIQKALVDTTKASKEIEALLIAKTKAFVEDIQRKVPDLVLDEAIAAVLTWETAGPRNTVSFSQRVVISYSPQVDGPRLVKVIIRLVPGGMSPDECIVDIKE